MSPSSFLSHCNTLIEELSLPNSLRDHIDSEIDSFYSLHSIFIEELLMCGYIISDICFREINPSVLWNNFPRSDLYISLDNEKILECPNLVLVIELSLPNLPETENLSDTRYLRIEYSQEWSGIN